MIDPKVLKVIRSGTTNFTNERWISSTGTFRIGGPNDKDFSAEFIPKADSEIKEQFKFYGSTLDEVFEKLTQKILDLLPEPPKKRDMG